MISDKCEKLSAVILSLHYIDMYVLICTIFMLTTSIFKKLKDKKVVTLNTLLVPRNKHPLAVMQKLVLPTNFLFLTRRNATFF